MKNEFFEYIIIILLLYLFRDIYLYNMYYFMLNINKLGDQKLIKKWKSILLPHIKELTNEQIESLKEQNFF